MVRQTAIEDEQRRTEQHHARSERGEPDEDQGCVYLLSAP